MSLFDRMKQGASEAARKVEQTVEITRLKAQISSREKEKDRLFGRIGEALYGAYTAGDLSRSEAEVMDYCAQLSELDADIAQINEKIKNIKLEKTCACGKVVPADAKFCPDCGRRFADEPKHEDTVGEIRVVCSSCKTENEIGSRYCIQCGADLSGTVAPDRGPDYTSYS